MKTLAKMAGRLVLVLSQAAQGFSQGGPPAGPETKVNPIDSANQYVALGDPIQAVAPKYPKHALKEHVQGDVVLRFSVTAQGKVRDISPISGDPELAEAATHAVRHWEFVPYFQDDRPIEAQAKITIVFKIDDTGHPGISAMYDAPRQPPGHRGI